MPTLSYEANQRIKNGARVRSLAQKDEFLLQYYTLINHPRWAEAVASLKPQHRNIIHYYLQPGILFTDCEEHFSGLAASQCRKRFVQGMEYVKQYLGEK